MGSSKFLLHSLPLGDVVHNHQRRAAWFVAREVKRNVQDHIEEAAVLLPDSIFHQFIYLLAGQLPPYSIRQERPAIVVEQCRRAHRKQFLLSITQNLAHGVIDADEAGPPIVYFTDAGWRVLDKSIGFRFRFSEFLLGFLAPGDVV